MPRRIYQVHLYRIRAEACLLGEYRNAALLFKLEVVQVCVAVIDPSPAPYRAGRKQKPLAKRGLSGIDMRKYSDGQFAFRQLLSLPQSFLITETRMNAAPISPQTVDMSSSACTPRLSSIKPPHSIEINPPMGAAEAR